MAYQSPIGSGFQIGDIFSSSNPNMAKLQGMNINLGSPNQVDPATRAGLMTGMISANSPGIKSQLATATGSNPPQARPPIQTTPPISTGAITSVAQAQQAGAYDRIYGAGSYARDSAAGSLKSMNPQPVTPQTTQTANISASPGNTSSGNRNSSSTGQPTGFGITTPPQTNSNVLGSGLSYSDVLTARNQLMNDYQTAQNQYANDYQTITGQTLKGQFSGDTQQYGTGMANLIKLEGTPVLTADQMRAENALNALGANQQTANLVNPLNYQVAPGNTAVNPVTGQPAYSGMGAAPATIAGLAQQMAQTDQLYGTLHTTPQGGIDYGYYYQNAQGFINGQGGNGGSSGSSFGNYSGSSSGAQSSYVQQGQGGGVSSMPSYLQRFADTATIGGQPLHYINDDRVPQSLKASAQIQARQAGIPYLTNNDVQGVQAVQQIWNVAEGAKALAIKELKPGVGGRIADTLTAWANNFLQFNPELSGFDQLRETASKALTALAGGAGSGLRINTSTLDAAVQNMPASGDNLETALTKVNNLESLITNSIAPKFPQLGNTVNLTGSSNNQSQNGGGFVQTRAGAVNTNWY